MWYSLFILLTGTLIICLPAGLVALFDRLTDSTEEYDDGMRRVESTPKYLIN